MEREILEKMKFFHVNSEKLSTSFGNKYERFNILFDNMVSVEGMIGDVSYLVLWRKSEIEEMNDNYAVQEFLSDIILIGSDGGDTAYGRNIQGKFIEVPFIGMDNEEVKIIADTFEDFINYLCLNRFTP